MSNLSLQGIGTITASVMPEIIVLQGNNLLKVQLYISIGNSIIAVAGISIFSGFFGVSGAATALLIAELGATILSAYFAKRWLDRNHLEFPWALLRVALTSITVAAVCILSMVAFQKQIILILAMALIANCFVAFVYYRNLPPLAVAKVHAMFRRRR